MSHYSQKELNKWSNTSASLVRDSFESFLFVSMVNLYVNLTSCVQRNHIVFNYTFSRHFYDAKILTLCVYWVQQNIAYKRVCAHSTNEQNELRETARKTEQTSLPTIVNMHSRNNFERHKYSSDIDDNNQGHLIECNVSLAVIHFYQTNANHLHVTIPEASNILFSVGNNQMDSVNFQTRKLTESI